MDLINLLRSQIRVLFESLIATEAVVDLIVVVIMVAFWLLLGFIVIKIVRLLVLKGKKIQDRQTKHGLTMKRLINNLIRAVFIFWIILMILQELGIDIFPVIAGAGVLAFAIGFGAQELVKDLIGGFFLILEKTFSLGDYVEIGSYSGTVEDIGLRRTKLLNWKGEVITLNNGDIKAVINASINPSVAVVKFKTEFATDSRVFESEQFKTFVNDFANNHPEVLSENNSVVITDLTTGDVTYQITFKTNTRKHIGVQRDFMKAFKEYTLDNKIDLEIPLVIEQNK